MTSVRTMLTGFGVFAVACCGAASAGDYEPVACDAARTYHGQPLHPAPAPLAISPGLSGAFDNTTAARFEQAIAKARQATGAPGLTAAVAVPGRGVWSTDAPAAGQVEYYWASAGKTFVAVVVLQLVEEGKLKLEDPVSRWISGVPNGDVITVRNLLEHTSGLFSANEDLKARAERRYRTSEEDLEIVVRHGAMFCPGELWRYSNSGYDLLGQVIEKVDGRAYPQAIAARVIAPLGLKHTRILTPNETAKDVAPLVSSKETPMNPSWAGAAGPAVGSSDDMIRFWHALLSGRLLKPDTTRMMFERLYPMFDAGSFYGLGVMLWDLPDKDGSTITWLGHGGGTPGANAIVAYSPRDKAFVAVALTGDGSAVATANLLLHQLRAQ